MWWNSKLHSTYSLDLWAWGFGNKYHRGLHCQGPCTRLHFQLAGAQRGLHCRARPQYQRPWERGTLRKSTSSYQDILPWSLISAVSPSQTPSHPPVNGKSGTLSHTYTIHQTKHCLIQKEGAGHPNIKASINIIVQNKTYQRLRTG